MKRIVSCFVVLVFAFSAIAQQPAFITDSLDSYITREMQQWQIPGVAVAIVKDGKVIVSK